MANSIDNAASRHALRADRVRILGAVRRLAMRPPSPWPVLSVYVNTRPVGPQMTTYRPFFKRRMSDALAALPPRSPERESLAVDFARAQHYLDYDLRENTRAVAAFASYAGEDLFDAVQLPIEFPEQEVAVGSVPVLFPLLQVADRYHRVAVAIIEESVTRLFVLALGDVEARREVRVRAAWDESSSARGAEPGLVVRSARTLEELAREVGASWIVVGGEGAAPRELRAELAAEAADLLLDAGAWDRSLPEPELVAEITLRVDQVEAEIRVDRARTLVDAALGGTAALGVDATLEALRQDRVRELLLSATFPALVPAWTCRACRTFGGGSPPGACPVCARETIEPVPLREELGAQAEARGAPVLFVASGTVPAFDDGGGVGAFLR